MRVKNFAGFMKSRSVNESEYGYSANPEYHMGMGANPEDTEDVEDADMKDADMGDEDEKEVTLEDLKAMIEDLNARIEKLEGGEEGEETKEGEEGNEEEEAKEGEEEPAK